MHRSDLDAGSASVMIYQMAYLTRVSSGIGDNILQEIESKFNSMCDRLNLSHPIYPHEFIRWLTWH